LHTHYYVKEVHLQFRPGGIPQADPVIFLFVLLHLASSTIPAAWQKVDRSQGSGCERSASFYRPRTYDNFIAICAELRAKRIPTLQLHRLDGARSPLYITMVKTRGK
jgi:hypothetical protein